MDIENPYRQGLNASAQRPPAPSVGVSVFGRIKFVVLSVIILGVLGMASIHVHSASDIDQISAKLMSLRNGYSGQSLRGVAGRVGQNDDGAHESSTPEEGSYTDMDREERPATVHHTMGHSGSGVDAKLAPVVPPPHGTGGEERRGGSASSHVWDGGGGVRHEGIKLSRLSTSAPTPTPTARPSSPPTPAPTPAPTAHPTARPTAQPTVPPTTKPVVPVKPSVPAQRAEKVDLCKGIVDPWERVPVESFIPAEDVKEVTMSEIRKWKEIMKDLMKRVTTMSYGGPKLREDLENMVRKVVTTRFEMFCKFEPNPCSKNMLNTLPKGQTVPLGGCPPA